MSLCYHVRWRSVCRRLRKCGLASPLTKLPNSHAHPFRDLVVVHGGGFLRDGRPPAATPFKIPRRRLIQIWQEASSRDFLCRRAAWSSVCLSLCPPRLLPLPRPSAAANAADATWVGRFGRTSERRESGEEQTPNDQRSPHGGSVTPDHMCERCAFSSCSAASVEEEC